MQYLIGAASAWGANAPQDAIYLNVVPQKNDGMAVYELKVAEVPVDGFWSISVYNDRGYYEKNALNAYTINNITAKKDADGAVTVRFGGCDGKVPNCLPVTKGWNYMVRLYRPRAPILEGKWAFPQAQLAK
ncbi:hypothetical protein D3C76_1557510 [compost metagenome]